MFERLRALLGADIKVEVHRADGEHRGVEVHHLKARIDFSSSSEDPAELKAELKQALHDAGTEQTAQKAAIDDFVARHGLTVQSFEAD
jgi:hypothetical protein